MAIEILFSKFLSFVNIKYANEISLSEDEFDFSLLDDEIIFIHKRINDRENNNEHGNEIRDIKRRKIGIINSECESNN